MVFPTILESDRIKRLQYPQGTVRMVLDTDTFNEIDDQFAVVYALQSYDRLKVEALYAAPFLNDRSVSPEDGMEKSYDELQRIAEKMGQSPEGFIFKGSRSFLANDTTPSISEAAVDLIDKALKSSPEDPLYVVAIGAITNVASAILMEPGIIANIVIVWLGGHALHWNHTMEFNLKQDIAAVRVILNCGVPLVLIPCQGVTSHLITNPTEIAAFVQGRGAIGDFLTQRFNEYSADHFGYSKVIWDIAAIAYLLDERFMESDLVHSPIVTDQGTWSFDSSRHFVRYVRELSRDLIYRDMFTKLAKEAE